MKRTLVVLMVAWGVGASGVAWADSPLAAAARQEKKRRAKTPDPVKVITDDDLGPASDAPTASEETGSGAEAPPTPADGASAGDANARRDDIQREINAQLERIRAVRKQVDDAERELADQLGPSFGPRRAQNAQLRDDGLKAIAEIETRVAELEAEAKRLGVSVTRPQ